MNSNNNNEQRQTTTGDAVAYDDMAFSEQQLNAHQEIMDSLNGESRNRWATLLAQMQSGKTEAYLLVCCEMLRVGRVNEAIIFTGNSDSDLKEQLKNELEGQTSKFWDKYSVYLEEKLNMATRDRYRVKQAIQSNIKVVWGPELKKYTENNGGKLFVWEESHHAQTTNQCPDKFLQTIGVSADGDFENLEKNDNFVISVSATPFSELSDNHHFTQNKKVVYMRPGNLYTSVKKIRDSGRLRQFDTVASGLKEALSIPHTSPKYAIVRISNKNEEVVKQIIAENGWNAVVFDSLSSGIDKILGAQTWKGMSNVPFRDTVILLRGKCRMGKNLQKKHVLFVMETAKDSRTDTVLQGLLGRVCGYSEGSDKIIVFLPKKIIMRGEINRYIDMIDRFTASGTIEILPKRANNLADKIVSQTDPIIPIKITRDRSISTTNDRKKIIEDLYCAFTNDVRISNKNSQDVFSEVREKFITAYQASSSNLKVFYLDAAKKTRGIDKANKLVGAFTEGQTLLLGSGCGIDIDGLEINIWTPKNIPGMNNDEIYITAHVKKTETTSDNMPTTTGREVFRHRLEDGTELNGNGGFTVELSKETALDLMQMSRELSDIVNLSISLPNSSKKVASCWDDKSKLYKGIIVSQEIFKALSIGGAIYNDIQTQYGVRLTIEKSRGPVPKMLSQKGCLRLASVSW